MVPLCFQSTSVGLLPLFPLQLLARFSITSVFPSRFYLGSFQGTADPREVGASPVICLSSFILSWTLQAGSVVWTHRRQPPPPGEPSLLWNSPTSHTSHFGTQSNLCQHLPSLPLFPSPSQGPQCRRDQDSPLGPYFEMLYVTPFGFT